jgi:hypothetical protein
LLFICYLCFKNDNAGQSQGVALEVHESAKEVRKLEREIEELKRSLGQATTPRPLNASFGTAFTTSLSSPCALRALSLPHHLTHLRHVTVSPARAGN